LDLCLYKFATSELYYYKSCILNDAITVGLNPVEERRNDEGDEMWDWISASAERIVAGAFW